MRVIINSSFKPAWWLPGGHLQTLWPFLFRPKLLPEIHNQRLELADGDFIDISWSPKKDAPLICLFHGLEGSLRSHYAAGLMQCLDKAGYQSVLMHFRSCSGEMNRLPRSYHSGDTADIAFFLRWLREKYPHRKIAAIGVSLGGNALLKYLAENSGDKQILDCAIAVSVPLLLANAAQRLDRGLSKLYQWHLLRSLRNSVLNKRRSIKNFPISKATILSCKNLWQFDDKVTAPVHGFKNANDYYNQSSSRQYLKKIKTSCLIMQASDDPFMTPATLPEASELSPEVQLETSPHGGHVGFIGGEFPWRPTYWIEERSLDFLQTKLI